METITIINLYQFLLLGSVFTISTSKFSEPCEVFYKEGVDAYLNDYWNGCILYLEKAVHCYKVTKNHTVQCRLNCDREVRETPLVLTENIDDLNFYEKMIRKTLCLLKCMKSKNVPVIQKAAEQIFEDMKPYEYLHICYFQENKMSKAASAAYTYLVAHPDHEIMRNNLKYYTADPMVDVSHVVNYEAKKHVSLYLSGLAAYENGKFGDLIKYMEDSLIAYLQEEEECRLFCESPFDQGWFPDFVSSVANHYTYCLKCKRRCPVSLSRLDDERREDLLASHFHYLQFAYYKTNNIEKACEAVATYLLFHPEDETMLRNKMLYSKSPETKESYFTPRHGILLYKKRESQENKLLDFVQTEFSSLKDTDNEIIDTDVMKPPLLESKRTQQIHSQSQRLHPPSLKKSDLLNMAKSKETNFLELERNSQSGSDFMNSNCNAYDTEKESETKTQEISVRRRKRAVLQVQNMSKRNVTVIMGEKQLRGKSRVLADGFAEVAECERLMTLAKIASVQGDGYLGKSSPHSKYETFEGVSVGRIALLVYFGLIENEMLELFLNVSNRGRDYVERYFNLKNELYFSYTHLVCRTALKDSPIKRTDMSHDVHADNCNLLDNGDCIKKPPSYYWRDYSAIIYLNSDFEGGEFFFTADINASHIQSKVNPQCGRLVGFSAGKENLHGVLAVRSGRRCALGMWFTHDPHYAEAERTLAEALLQEVEQNESVSEQLRKQLVDSLT